MASASSPKRNLLPSGDSKSTGNTKISPCWRNAQEGVFVGVAHHCPTAHNALFSQVYPDPQSCLFPPFCDPMSLKTPTGEPENASAPELPRLPHARNWPLFRVCYRFKALQGEQRSLWTSNGSLIPDLRSHITPPEAIFMPAFPLPPMQFPTPLCIHLRHSTRGAIT